MPHQQEWWGINEDIKEKALLLHQKGGCRVFIPDLYEGKVTVEVAEAKHVSRAESYLSHYSPHTDTVAAPQVQRGMPDFPSHAYSN